MTKINLKVDSKILKVSFQLGEVVFEVKFTPQSTQRGDLWVNGIKRYEEIKQQMSRICSSVRCARIVQAIREARQTGNPLTTRSFDCEEVGEEVGEKFDEEVGKKFDEEVGEKFDEEVGEKVDVNFLNHFMFLWNCEIARHLQTPITNGNQNRDERERNFHDLPVAVGICLANFSTENRKPENGICDFHKYLDKGSSHHFFSGKPEERKQALLKVMSKDSFPDEYFDDLLVKEFGNPTLS